MTPEDLVALYSSSDSTRRSSALEGLDQVDWSAVSDCYGPATDLPALLRALVCGDPDHREFACQLLHETIWHQGNVFSATATAIPFLYRLLETGDDFVKECVASLIALIADGEPPFLHCETDPKAAAEWRTTLDHVGRSLDAEIAQGHLIAQAIRRELERRPDLLAWCRARDDDER
jgi:hypothetical protein